MKQNKHVKVIRKCNQIFLKINCQSDVGNKFIKIAFKPEISGVLAFADTVRIKIGQFKTCKEARAETLKRINNLNNGLGRIQ